MDALVINGIFSEGRTDKRIKINLLSQHNLLNYGLPQDLFRFLMRAKNVVIR
jgi:hypothetical protein